MSLKDSLRDVRLSMGVSVNGSDVEDTGFWVLLQKTILAGVVYFAIVLCTGFVLGMFRVPILVPRMGERWAELMEMPIMATVIFFAAGYILRRFPGICTPGRSLVAGFLALALTVSAELGLAGVLQSQTIPEFISSRDKVSGSVYLALLFVFAIMPRVRLRNHGSAMPRRREA